MIPVPVHSRVCQQCELPRVRARPCTPATRIGHGVVGCGVNTVGVAGFRVDRPVKGIKNAHLEQIVYKGVLPLSVNRCVGDVVVTVLHARLGLVGQSILPPNSPMQTAYPSARRYPKCSCHPTSSFGGSITIWHFASPKASSWRLLHCGWAFQSANMGLRSYRRTIAMRRKHYLTLWHCGGLPPVSYRFSPQLGFEVVSP